MGVVLQANVARLRLTFTDNNNACSYYSISKELIFCRIFNTMALVYFFSNFGKFLCESELSEKYSEGYIRRSLSCLTSLSRCTIKDVVKEIAKLHVYKEIICCNLVGMVLQMNIMRLQLMFAFSNGVHVCS